MDESTFYPHITSEYTYRIPTPPRIIVPPPLLHPEVPSLGNNAAESADFLHEVDFNHFIAQNTLLEWNYERRREAQLILPYLYLGPMNAAKDETFLRGKARNAEDKARGVSQQARPITMLLGIRQKFGIQNRLMTGVLKKAEEMGITIHTVDLASNQELIQVLPQTTSLITDHLNAVYRSTGQVGCVLVFCESGNERSAGVVAAYMMETHRDLDYVKAMQLVQAQRFCANFDDPMKRLLQGYWDILCAKRQVAATRKGQSDGDAIVAVASGDRKMKRSLSRDEDRDEDMNGVNEDDMERFGGRAFQPFKDQP